MKPNPNLSAAELSNVRARVSELIEIYERELLEFAAELIEQLPELTPNEAKYIGNQLYSLRTMMATDPKRLKKILKSKATRPFQKGRYEPAEKLYSKTRKSILRAIADVEKLKSVATVPETFRAFLALENALKAELSSIQPRPNLLYGRRRTYGTVFESRCRIADELRHAVPPQHRARFLRALHKVLFAHGVDIDLRTLTALTKFPKKISEKS
jgi:hypothetical protein